MVRERGSKMPMLIFKQKMCSGDDSDHDHEMRDVVNMIVERAFRTDGL